MFIGATGLEMPVYVAVIEALPFATPVTNPPATVAALELDVVQVALDVRVCVDPSL